MVFLMYVVIIMVVYIKLTIDCSTHGVPTHGFFVACMTETCHTVSTVIASLVTIVVFTLVQI